MSYDSSIKPTHCVVMVTYNHEKYIRFALDSVFDNDVLPDKVVLCDDCSQDNTWAVVEEFKTKYPDIIDCYRNEKNLGIFQNINQAYKFGLETGCDIITDLAGDDYLKKGLFKELNRVVEENKIDIKNEKFIIVTNTETLNPDGSGMLVDNYRLRHKKDLSYYRFTHQLSYREVGLSRNVLLGIKPYRTDLGVWADLVVSMEYETNCEHFYFTPFVSAGYRVGVGIVSRQIDADQKRSRYEAEKIVLRDFKIGRRTKKCIKYEIHEYEYELAKEKYQKKEIKHYPLFLYFRCYGIKKIIKLFVPYGLILLLQKIRRL